MIKSYKHNFDLNTEKQNYIETILYPEWLRVSDVLMKLHMNYYYKHNCVCNASILYKSVNSFLTERYKDCINRQIVGLFQSKISNFKNKYVKIVMKSKLSDALKTDLCLVNKRNLFFTNVDNIGKNYVVPLESIKLGRWIFKNFFGKLPSCKHINMVLQSKVVVIEKPDNSNNDFKYMLKLSAGDKTIRGKFIYIPVLKNKYADKFEGKLSTSCSFNFKNRKFESIVFTKDIEIQKPVLNKITISFDIGLNKFIVLNNGECYGIHYMKRLKHLDLQLIKLQNEIKLKYGEHVKLSQVKEYSDLVKYIRSYSTNEINRLINKIYNKHKPSTIVLEDLDFKGSNLYKTTNRLLHKFGIGIITKKLLQLKSDYGVKIKYVDASYSSQTCDCCKYVDIKNRKTQEGFKCLACGKKVNADVNGSRTVKYFNERFGEMKFYGNKGRFEKRTLLVDDFINSKVWMNDLRLVQVLLDNNYFKHYHSMLRENVNKNVI